MTIATVVNNVGEVEIQVDDLDGGQSRTQCVEVTLSLPPGVQARPLIGTICCYSDTQLVSLTQLDRPQRSIETIALFDQWSGTIENH